MNYLNMNNVFFEPWKGENYKSGGIFNKKILVLGESQYGVKDVDKKPSATIERVLHVVSGDREKWTGTYRRFERSLVGHYTSDEESKEIWNSVVFYNYVQKSLSDTDVDPSEDATEEELKQWEDAFFEVLENEKYQPDLIIGWGKRLCNMMPGELGNDIRVEGQREYAKTCVYELKNHKRILSIWVNHPSKYYSWSKWYRIMLQVLK